MTTGALPTGTVTFLLTDIEDSTRLWDEAPAEMRTALERHDEIVAKAVARNDGFLHGPRGEGDSHFAVFARPADAVATAIDIQLALAREDWPTPSPLRIRIGVHTGQADLRGDDYYGSDVNRAARIRSLARGGQTLVSQSTATIVENELPLGSSLHDLGTHTLRGLKRQERLFDLRHDDLPTVSAALERAELPVSLTSFVGRRHEVDTLSRLLRSVRLLTLTGAGGMGKTRLALRLAEASAEEFRDGVWFIDLAPLRGPDLVPHAAAAALGVRADARDSLVDALVVHLRRMHALLLLDNCEHVVETTATLVHSILSSCSAIKVVATSREPLRVDGEHLWPVPPLQLQTNEAQAPVARIARQDAVSLFCERARQHDPAFELSESNAGDVVAICGTVDAMPLAIELAAARVRTLGAREVNARLANRLELLAGDGRTTAERHRSLEAAIDWSYNLLDDDERSLFRRSAVFAGGFSIDAAESVAFQDVNGPVIDVLSRLVDKSMVTVTRDTEDRPRFHLLETLRLFADERLSEIGETEDAQRRHLGYYMSFAERTAAASESPDQGAWLDRLDAEHDNFRVALDTAVRLDPRKGLRLAAALSSMWAWRWQPREGSAWLMSLLDLIDDCDIPYLDALLAAEHLTWRQARYDEAADLLVRASALSRRLGDPFWLARAANAEAFFHGTAGDLDVAMSAATNGLEIASRLGYTSLLRTATQTITFVELLAERPAIDHASRALDLARQVGVPSETAVALQTFAMSRLEEGDVPAAKAAAEERLRISRELHLRGHLQAGLTVLAGVSAAQGDPVRALRISAAIAGLTEITGFVTPPGYDRLYQRWIRPALAALSTDAAARARSEGEALNEQQLIAYALGEADPFAASRNRRSVLTNRELEVANRLTEGLTNAQIAEKLVLSERTIDAHVEHIRNKLALRTRAQIAAWVTEQALTKPTDV